MESYDFVDSELGEAASVKESEVIQPVAEKVAPETVQPVEEEKETVSESFAEFVPGSVRNAASIRDMIESQNAAPVEEEKTPKDEYFYRPDSVCEQTENTDKEETPVQPSATVIVDENLEAKLAAIEAQAKANEAKLAALEAQNKAMEDMIGSVLKKYSSSEDTLRGTVETLRKSVTLNQSNNDSLKKENEALKSEESLKRVKPFLEMLINIHVEMTASLAQYDDKAKEDLGEKAYAEIVDLHDYFIKLIESQFQLEGLLMSNYEEGSDFKSGEQIISKPVPTEDKSLVGKIAQCKSYCYSYDGKVLRKAKVYVYK